VDTHIFNLLVKVFRRLRNYDEEVLECSFDAEESDRVNDSCLKYQIIRKVKRPNEKRKEGESKQIKKLLKPMVSVDFKNQSLHFYDLPIEDKIRIGEIRRFANLELQRDFELFEFSKPG